MKNSMIIKNNYQHLENKYQNLILNNKKEDNELKDYQVINKTINMMFPNNSNLKIFLLIK